MNANGDKIYCFDRFAVSFAACHLLKIVLASQVGCRSIGALEYCLYVFASKVLTEVRTYFFFFYYLFMVV